MNIAQIEGNVTDLVQAVFEGKLEKSQFIYELLLAYNHRKQSVTRLRSGERNLASTANTPLHDTIIWKRHLYFKSIQSDALYAQIDEMKNEKQVASNKLRFIIVTNFEHLLAFDCKTSDSLDIELEDLPKQFDFFLPWAGMEKALYQGENPADVKAAEKMAKLFDLVKKENFDKPSSDNIRAQHNLNVFLTRLLFCYFAEDTEIFRSNQFSLAIKSHTRDDGSDLSDYLNRLFTVLNLAHPDRSELPNYLADFPYVNGGLFDNKIPSPSFSAKSRRLLIECGEELDWSDINPDIFGSMIQAVVHPDQRGGMGMHYTSVTNILKVIEPLFLNGLYEELEKVDCSTKKLQQLQQRIGEIKIFDPACGSGNFLIIAYKELRKLEMEVLKRLQELEAERSGQILQPFSVIKLTQFYGIELDDFAHEVAILSLWLAEHQMNVEFKTEFGRALPSLPLRSAGNILAGNAIRMNWDVVCADEGREIYLIGNPPYLGARNQNEEQKLDVSTAFNGHSDYKDADYVSCWLLKASDFISSKAAAYAFVTTNSISQGEQVSLIWSRILSAEQEIFFAHQSFKWSNNAKGNAGVTCVIVGVRNQNKDPKHIYNEGMMLKQRVVNISPYLTEGPNIFVRRSRRILSWLPKMVIGNMARDGGHLILTEEDKNNLLNSYPEATSVIRKLYGTQEWIKGVPRYAIWIGDNQLDFANKIEPLKKRIDDTYKFRMKSKAKTTNQYAKTPHKFAQRCEKDSLSIIIPSTTSERRTYIPIGFMEKDVVITNSANAIFEASLDVFGIISSYLHILWVKAIGGQLETRIRYSPEICYNTFPVPEIRPSVKEEIAFAASKVIAAREHDSRLTIETLYDPESMPAVLLNAHLELDHLVEKAMLGKIHDTDAEKLAALLDSYSQLTCGENA